MTCAEVEGYLIAKLVAGEAQNIYLTHIMNQSEEGLIYVQSHSEISDLGKVNG